MEVFQGKRQILGECSIVSENPKDGSPSAMCLETTFAEPADGPEAQRRTGDIDFSSNATAHPSAFFTRRKTRDFHDLSDKFMPRNAFEAMITAKNFDVGVANACETHFYKRPTHAQTWYPFFCADQFAGLGKESKQENLRTVIRLDTFVPQK
jgi:hypothetical protein